MCNRHYEAWRVANPSYKLGTQSVNAIEQLLPATQAQLIERSGYRSSTVRRALDILRDKGRAHIGDYVPPNSYGANFYPIFFAGPGEDMKLTKTIRDQQRRKTWNEGYHRRQAKLKLQALPPGAGWAAALLVKAPRKTPSERNHHVAND